MLRQQLSKGNNGLTKTKFLTYGIEGESMAQVKPRLEHIQNDLMNNFHRLGVLAKPLDGTERLRLMHGIQREQELMLIVLSLSCQRKALRCDGLRKSPWCDKPQRRLYGGQRLSGQLVRWASRGACTAECLWWAVCQVEHLPMLKEFCKEQFVSKGMIADFAIHDKGDGNPHAHILLTIRAMDEHGKWLPKARKVYDLDENGERIQLPSGNWKCHKENTVDWNDQKYAEVWRHSWEVVTNHYLEAAGRPERVDLRSFERQGVQQIPTVHLGPAAHQMEKRGIETFLGNLNRDIRAANSLMQSIRSTIRGLQRWIADLTEKKQILLDALEQAKEPTLSDLLVDYFNLRNEQRSDWSSKAQLKCSARDLNEVMQAVDYLKAHSLNTVEDLNAAIKDLSQTAAPLRKQLKQNENRMRAIAQIKDAAAIHAKLKPIHDTFLKKNFKLTKDAYAAQHKEELDAFNKAVRTLMKLNGGTTVDFSALDAEFSALQSGSAELRSQLETLQPDLTALKNVRKYIDLVLNKQQLSAPGGKTPEKESVLKQLEQLQQEKSKHKAITAMNREESL